MHLTPALENVHALLRGDDRVAVEVRAALLELSEVLDAAERALRSEQALDLDAAKRRRIDAMPERLRANIPDKGVWPRPCAR